MMASPWPQIDLELRGPGDFFGTGRAACRPCGPPNLAICERWNWRAPPRNGFLPKIPEFTRPDHRALAARVAAFWAGAPRPELKE